MTEFDKEQSLKAKHASLERQVREEQKRVRPDAARVWDLKRHKLRIKDHLHALLARRHKPFGGLANSTR